MLPGQLKDIVEAIGDFQNRPPPLPTLPRPRLARPDQSVASVNSNWSSNRSDSGGSDASGSFRGHLTYKGGAPDMPMDGHSEGGGTVGNINQLNRRQADLALKALSTDIDHTTDRRPKQRYEEEDPYKREPNPVVWSEFSFGAPPSQENSRRRDANQNYAESASGSDSEDSLDPNAQEGPVRPLLPAAFRLDKNPGLSKPSPPSPPGGPPSSGRPLPPPGPPPPSHTHPEPSESFQSAAVFQARTPPSHSGAHHPPSPTSPMSDQDETFAARSEQNPGLSLRAVYK